MSNSSIWPIDRTLSDATTPKQSGPASDGNKGVFRIPQSSSITKASPLDCLVSYPGRSFGKSYPSAEMQSVYSEAKSLKYLYVRIVLGDKKVTPCFKSLIIGFLTIVSKVGDLSRGWPEGSLFNCYNTKV